MAVATLDEGYALSRAVIAGMLLLAYMLLYGGNAAHELIRAWRGTGGGVDDEWPLIDPFFFEGLRPVWTGVALAYGLASVYLRFGVDEQCPTWAWTLFFAIGGAMFW